MVEGTYALKFDGQDDYVRVEASDDFSGIPELTVQGWVKINSEGGYSLVGFSGPMVDRNWELRISNNKLCFHISSGTEYEYFIHDQSLNVGTWHHVAATYQEGGDVVLYIDGV
ncbi:MAG: LamG-like jellyroll fold domain-containing protein, partial [Armatimonadota bacterium]